MDGFLNRYATYMYSIMRIVTGFLFLWHGAQKLLGYPPSQNPAPGGLTPIMTAGGVIELVGGFLIMIGLFTPVAAFIASGTMAVAYFGWHYNSAKLLPLQNGGELAALYSFVLLYIASRGSGVWSIDSIFRSGRPKRR